MYPLKSIGLDCPIQLNGILLDYFWLDDPFWHDELCDDFDAAQFDSMFSLDCIQKIIDTFVRFAKYIDKEWVEHNNRRKKPQVVK